MSPPRSLRSWLALLALACGDAGDRPAIDAALPDAAAPDAAPPLNACDPARLPMNRPSPSACCLVGDEEWFIAGTGNLVHRKLASACTVDGVTGGCTGMACAYGPCGARILETFTPPAYVFRPMSDPAVCGRQATGLAGTPEEWTPAHASYPAATTGCPYTDCEPTGPVVKLTVMAASSAAAGRVTSTPSGIDVAAGAMTSATFRDVAVELTAQPTGERARAVFSGDCVATGAYGQVATCALTLGPDKTVTVTFECEDGATCPP
jgi:hypothetical protein